MTVKELKEIIASSTSIILYLSETKEDVFNEKFIGRKLTYKGSNDNCWENYKVVNIYPKSKDELEVWCIK